MDLDGRVVGVNAMKVQGGAGISFAIPIDTVLSIAAQLRANGKVMRPYVGMRVHQHTAHSARTPVTGLSSIVSIVDVDAGSPAYNAGLRP